MYFCPSTNFLHPLTSPKSEAIYVEYDVVPLSSREPFLWRSLVVIPVLAVVVERWCRWLLSQ